MNIHPRPDQEATIQEAISCGLIASGVDALDIGLENLRLKFINPRNNKTNSGIFKNNNLVDLFDRIRGDDIDFQLE